ncbi:hypothetical protein [Leisingera sp. MMG026]|uniref:hypothetical protein n=1 Tax=Leisingera sp. MMG026 TaxID=2909982 RepID=UPI001F3D66B4|nr:hypothetical protein [Leisingera sp. MMG026]MCF6433036.1 hypothetical protein [Leisingera sp. MMG026]
MLDHLGIARDAFVQADELVALDAKHAVRNGGHVRVITVMVTLCKSRNGFDPNRQNMSKLAQQATDHVGQLGALPDGQVTRSVDG